MEYDIADPDHRVCRTDRRALCLPVMGGDPHHRSSRLNLARVNKRADCVARILKIG